MSRSGLHSLCPHEEQLDILTLHQEHRRTRLRGPGYNPHGGAYAWSDNGSSDEFYRPSRIPHNSYRHWDHQQRYDDWSGNSSDRSDYRRCHLTRGGYEDETEDEMQLDDRGQLIRRGARMRREVEREREDERQRRNESRQFYRGRREQDAGSSDNNLSETTLTPRERRAHARLATNDWAQDFRSMGPLFTQVAFTDGLERRHREAAEQRRVRYRSSSEESWTEQMNRHQTWGWERPPRAWRWDRDL